MDVESPIRTALPLMIRFIVAVISIPVLASGCQRAADVAPADLVFLNGGIYTVDADRSWAEAMAIRDGEIVALGDNELIDNYVNDQTRVVDLTGLMALPGLHDSHIHPLEGGYLMRYCDLSKEGTSVEAIKEIIAGCVEASDEEWIVGFGINLALFGINGPDKSLLDDIAPDRLFFIDAKDGHSVLVNDKVLALAGITADTPDPEGGVIERREGTREPNGTLRETARDIADALRPKRTVAESTEAMFDAIKAMNAAGITSAIDAWSGELEMQAYQALSQSGKLSVRVVNSIIDEGVFGKHFGDDLERVLAARNDYADELIDNNAIKIMVDGVFEGETASLVDPYLNEDHRGGLNHTAEELRQRVARYDAMGLQVHMHTMGDGGARAGLDAIEFAIEQNADNPSSGDNRHHLSHLGLIHPDDIARFGELDVSANFTGAWAYPSDWVLELNIPTMGQERVDRMYPIRSVHDAGGTVVGGSDWIYGPLDPFESIEVAITRSDPQIDDGLASKNMNDAVDVALAIDMYTINGAWLMHHEDITGSLEVGKRADVAVIDQNLFDIPATDIGNTKVKLTVFDGRVVYDDAATTR